MVLTIISLLIAVAAVSLALWREICNRNFWYQRYEQRDKEAKEERDHLFAQLCMARGARTVDQPPRPEPVVYQKQVDPDEKTYLENVIAEAVSLKRIGGSEGLRLMQEVSSGKLTRSEMERLIWQWKQPGYEGSIADI